MPRRPASHPRPDMLACLPRSPPTRAGRTRASAPYPRSFGGVHPDFARHDQVGRERRELGAIQEIVAMAVDFLGEALESDLLLERFHRARAGARRIALF